MCSVETMRSFPLEESARGTPEVATTLSSGMDTTSASSDTVGTSRFEIRLFQGTHIPDLYPVLVGSIDSSCHRVGVRAICTTSISGDHCNQDPSGTQKTICYGIFTQRVWS